MTVHQSNRRDEELLRALTAVALLLKPCLDAPFSLKLWDGSETPLGSSVIPGLAITIKHPGVVPSLLRRPSLDRLIRHYARGHIVIDGGTLIDIGTPFAIDRSARRRLKQVSRASLLKSLWPLLKAPGISPNRTRAYTGNAAGDVRLNGDDKRFVGFHYDVGNAFYELFLDPEMQYSCAYFPTSDTDLADAQIAKLDMICRKLRLKPGDRLLDIGCGWGGLLCHAVLNYGVSGHGVTLSEEQMAFAVAKTEKLGIADSCVIELKDYRDLDSTFDKIVSVGMYEHIGLRNVPGYFQHIQTLLTQDGLFLNHAIARRAKKRRRRLFKRPEQRALQKYIFPGGELDDIGHSIAEMERAGFEIHDVENWRRHYETTTRLWCEGLAARRLEAEALVGPELYRLWSAYLGGCSLAFARGSARIYQTLATKSAKGTPALPPTRSDLYE